MRCNPFYKGDYFDPVPETPGPPHQWRKIMKKS